MCWNRKKSPAQFLFLASDAAAYITGQLYDINYGNYMFWSAGSPAETRVKIGGGGATEGIPMLAATTPLPMQLVSGYKGTSEVRLASESGELEVGPGTQFAQRDQGASMR